VKTEGFVTSKQAKLADEKFAARAPAAVIAKEREQLAELEARLSSGRAVLAELEGRRASSSPRPRPKTHTRAGRSTCSAGPAPGR